MATDTPQRRWQALCPNCGAPVEFASAASSSAVCGFCKSSLLRDGEALRKIGHSADLIEDYSPLQLGASGRYAGAAFTVVGRVQLSYAEGSWNEWHVLFEGGPDGFKSGWLAEDNGSFVLGFEAPLTEQAPQSHELVLGERRIVGGQGWSVAALTLTTLAAAEGELPHAPALGKKYLVAELRNDKSEVGSLEYNGPRENDPPQWSVGRAVRIADLAMSGLRQDSSKSLASRALPCPNCGASLEPKLGSTQSIVCGQCRSVVDISQGAGAELKAYEQENGLEPLIPLGRTGQFALLTGGATLPWQVVGYQERCDLPQAGDDDEQTFWREYLLYNKAEGFIFLVDTEDGWSVVRPLTGAPQGGGADVKWQGKPFRRKYGYLAKTTYVLGEFYWQVKRGERVQVVDYDGTGKAGGELLSREQAGQEVTWSHGRKVDAAEVAKAFKLAPERAAALKRDSSSLSGGSIVRTLVIVAVVIIVLLILMRACSGDDCQAYKDSYGETSAEYQQCRRSSGGGRIYPSGGSYSGGSFGGSGGGGGHK